MTYRNAKVLNDQLERCCCCRRRMSLARQRICFVRDEGPLKDLVAGLERWIDHSLLEGHCVDVKRYRRKKRQDDFLKEPVRASYLYVSDRYLLRSVDTSAVEIVVVVADEVETGAAAVDDVVTGHRIVQAAFPSRVLFVVFLGEWIVYLPLVFQDCLHMDWEMVNVGSRSAVVQGYVRHFSWQLGQDSELHFD